MNRMFRLLYADEIECRVSTVNEKGCSLLLYKDARVDQNILDETVGAYNWQRRHELINGNLFCSVGVRDSTGEWVWKQDVGTESYTEKEKGQASDAFKRACFNWGIGRELYTAPFIWIPAGKVKIDSKNGKCTTYDRFEVFDIGYKDDSISKLIIVNEKSRQVVFRFDEGAEESEGVGEQKITKTDAEAIRNMLKRLNKTEAGICEYFHIDTVEDMTVKMMSDLNQMIQQAGKKKEEKQ